MRKYHVNPVTHSISVCGLAADRCPYGSPQEHYTYESDAWAALERIQGKSLLQLLLETEDECSLLLPSSLEAMLAAASPKHEAIYREAATLYVGQTRHAAYRFQALYRHRAEVAHRQGAEDAFVAYYMLYSLAKALRELRYQLQRQEEKQVASAFYKAKMAHDPEALASYATYEEELEEQELALWAAWTDKLEQLCEGTFPVVAYDVLEDDYSSSYFQEQSRDALVDLRALLFEEEGSLTFAEAPLTKRAEGLALLELHSQELMEALTALEDPEEVGSFEEGEVMGGPVPGAEDFDLIAGGSEMNVYLHRPTMVVYKVRHASGLWLSEHLASDDVSMTYRREQVMSFLEESYSAVEQAALTPMGARQLKTYFLWPHDSSTGEELPMLAQPFLEPTRYGPYSVAPEEGRILRRLGFNDILPQNVCIDTLTGDIILFDCLYGEPEDWFQKPEKLL